MVNNDDNIKEMRETFSVRLQRARKMRGLSISELAKRLEGIVSSTAIEKYEKAQMFPQSSTILIALAETLQVPVGDLLRPITLNMNMKEFSFRKKSKLGKKAEESILLKIQQSVEKYFEIEEIANQSIAYTLGKTPYVVDSADKARQAAKDVRKAWNLGNQPIALPILLLEEHGVKVIEVEEDPNLFDGSSNTINGTPIIVLNRRTKDASHPEEERRRLTTFHEFGHQYMSIPEELTDKIKEELCNIFANEMLITSEEFIRLIGDKRKVIYPMELRQIQELYGISGRALMMKARQLNVINESAFKWFCISMNKNLALRSFVDACIAKQSHSSRFEQLVIRTLDAEIITMGKAAELLGMKIGELHEKLNFT